MSELTEEEKAILAELEKEPIDVPGRKAKDFDGDFERTNLLKGLVYKDIINFSIYANSADDYGYSFFHRKMTDGKRF